MKNILNDLRGRGVKNVQVSALKEGVKRLNSVAGSWKDYEKLGFKRIAEDDSFIVGEIILS